ncbi:hypothetical protein [Alkaliphilus transvaalensis]|uniref:hypothetical protein n=1 Tax=Alkaliphilus transvaalensis TaxID=114628 RepID=UPI0012EC4FEF|nr:hypothetical protein [Alkaliphilus transvaalensis]
MKKLRGLLAAVTICALLVTSSSSILMNVQLNDSNPVGGGEVTILGGDPFPYEH